jgi:hypothetical protein
VTQDGGLVWLALLWLVTVAAAIFVTTRLFPNGSDDERR